MRSRGRSPTQPGLSPTHVTEAAPLCVSQARHHQVPAQEGPPDGPLLGDADAERRRARSLGDRACPHAQKRPFGRGPGFGGSASSGRAWWLWVARHLQGGRSPGRWGQPLSQVLGLAASEVAGSTAFGLAASLCNPMQSTPHPYPYGLSGTSRCTSRRSRAPRAPPSPPSSRASSCARPRTASCCSSPS